MSTNHPLQPPPLVFYLPGPSNPSHCPLARAKCLSNQTGPRSRILPHSAYQHRARVKVASGDRDSRPRPQIDCRKSLPHLCVRAARSATRALPHLYTHNRRRCVVVTDAGSYLRRIDFCITQLKAQGPSRTCNESKEEEKSRRVALDTHHYCRRRGPTCRRTRAARLSCPPST